MQIDSRNDKFTISTADDADIDPNSIERDVYLEHSGGARQITLFSIAYTIFYDCFKQDDYGLKLDSKVLNCHVNTGDADYSYHFRVEKPKTLSNVLYALSNQLII